MNEYEARLTEARVMQIAPPQGTFVRKFMAYNYAVSDAPLAFSQGIGLATLSVFIDPDLHVPWHNNIHAHMWTMVVGSSGYTRKSSVLSAGAKLIKDLEPSLVLSAPESEAGLLESLAALQDNGSVRAILNFGEMGAFLSGSTKGSYKETIRNRIMDIWDGSTQSRRTVRDELIIQNPRLSMLAACAPSLLERYTDDNDWQGGFMSRFSLVYGNRERSYSRPQHSPQIAAMRQDLLVHLASLMNQPCGRYDGFTPKADVLWDAWEAENDRKFGVSEQTKGLSSRMGVVAMKAALIYAYDWGIARTGYPWKIDEQLLWYATQFADYCADSSLAIVANMSLTPFGRDRRAVLRHLQGTGLTFGGLLRQLSAEGLSMSKRNLTEVLETLSEEGAVKTEMPSGSAPLYKAVAAQP
jgi:DNA-binding transcriptional ArsR family regulator